MAEKDVVRVATKAHVVLEQWDNHRKPADGEPDAVIEREAWFESDGTEVTDPKRIEELEASIQ